MWSRRAEDAWLGEWFLVLVVLVVATLVGGWMFLFAMAATYSTATEQHSYVAFMWLLLSLGFPLSAFVGCRLVRRAADAPSRRLFVLGGAGAVIAYSVAVGSLVVAVELIGMALTT